MGYKFPMRELSEAEFHRYARHLILDEVGEEGQARLLDARVVVIGAMAWARRRPCIWRRPGSAPWYWWTTTRST